MPRKPNDTNTPDARVQIRDFGGLQPATDPHDLPPGAAQMQVNATVVRVGELRARQGTRVVLFD